MDQGVDSIPGRAGRREWTGLGVLMLAVAVYVMDLTVLHLAVPRLSADLRPTSAELLWIIDVYGFVVAGALITMGSLGDRIGRRRLLMIGAAAFAAVSVVAAFSINSGMLIATRALMGVAGATLAPSTLSLIFVMFKDRRQRSFAVGLWIAAFSAGSAIGPVLGGVLIEHFWWGSVFLLAVPIMALLLVLGPRMLPEYRDSDGGKLDLVSAGISLLALLAVIFALKETAQDGFGVLPAIALAAALVFGLAFLRRQRRLADPLIDLRLFAAPGLRVALATNAVTIFIVVGYFLFVAQYLQLVIGLSPLRAGLFSVPSAVAFIVGSTISPRFIHKVRPGALIATCMVTGGIGLGLLTTVGVWGQLPVVVTASVVISLALSPVFNLTTEMIVGAAPPERAGVASGIAETGTELGGSLGLAVLGSIGAAVYRSRIASGVPADTDGAVVEAMKDTLGGAAAAVRELPAELARPLLGIAQDAFASSLRVTSATAAGLAFAVALVSAILLRGVRPLEAANETGARETGAGHTSPGTNQH